MPAVVEDIVKIDTSRTVWNHVQVPRRHSGRPPNGASITNSHSASFRLHLPYLINFQFTPFTLLKEIEIDLFRTQKEDVDFFKRGVGGGGWWEGKG